MVIKKRDSPLFMNILSLGLSFENIERVLDYPDYDNPYWCKKLIKALSILESQYTWILDNNDGLLEDDFLNGMRSGVLSVKQLKECVEGFDYGLIQIACANFNSSKYFLSKYIFTSR